MSDMIKIAGISLTSKTPTLLTFSQLTTWVIWQYPIAKKGGMCGAVSPAIEPQGWMPAIIDPHNEKVLVYSFPTFSTPSAAADWVATVKG